MHLPFRPDIEELLKDELNVKAVEYDAQPANYLTTAYRLSLPAVGSRFGSKTPQIIKAFNALLGLTTVAPANGINHVEASA